MKSDELHDVWEADSPSAGFSARVMDAYNKEKTLTSKATEVAEPVGARRRFRRGIILSLSCAAVIALGVYGAHRVGSQRIEKEPLALTQGPELAPSATPSAETLSPSTAITADGPVADVPSTVSVPSASRSEDLGSRVMPKSSKCSPHDPLCDVDSSGGSVAGSRVGDSLSADDIQKVLSRGQPVVKRSCWEPLQHGPPPHPNSRVDVTMSILATGRVDRALGTGGDSYPGLADCVVGITKTWIFPASGASTTVNIPFQFISVD